MSRSSESGDASSREPLIQPRTLQGFRDYLPSSMIVRERLIDTARQVYQSYGFSPIDTPALEYLEILEGRGGAESDKQLYKFQKGKRWIGLRFDLTVPLARFAAQHVGELGTPFKRYHIATVWRGERPQRGRFREFMQCDFDTIGTRSEMADIETALVIHDLVHRIGFDAFTIRINNRKVLNGLLEKLDLSDRAVDVLRALDKLSKIGRDRVVAEMVEVAGAPREAAERVVELADLDGSNDEILKQLEPVVAGNELGEQGAANLRQILRGVRAAGIPSERIRLDVGIARGLDYYTGAIFETFLDELPAIGSICSGGRYDDLAGMYTRQQLPGIGASLGLDRLLSAMEELGRVEPVTTPAPVFIPFFEATAGEQYLALAAVVRAAGFGVEVYPEPKKLGQQLKYADRRGFRLALIAGEDELARHACQLKDLRDGGSQEFSTEDGATKLLAAIAERLDP